MKPQNAHKRAYRSSRRKQAGMSPVGWLFLSLILGVVATLAGKLVPLYIDHNIMSNVFDGLASENGLIIKSDRTIRKLITKRFKVNGVRKFNVRENVKINRTNNGVELAMDYEVRVNLISNIDLVASFDKKVELRN